MFKRLPFPVKFGNPRREQRQQLYITRVTGSNGRLVKEKKKMKFGFPNYGGSLLLNKESRDKANHSALVIDFQQVSEYLF